MSSAFRAWNSKVRTGTNDVRVVVDEAGGLGPVAFTEGCRRAQRLVALLDGASRLAEEVNDGTLEDLIERALHQALSGQATAAERAGITVH